MIRINLIPETKKQYRVTPVVKHSVAVGALCCTVYFGVEYYGEKISDEIQEVEAKIAKQKEVERNLKKVIEKSNEIKERTEAIKKRTSRIQELGEGRKLSVIFLDNLQIKHPERMWFTKIAFNGAKKDIILSGYALDHTVIADYIKRIKEIGKIDTSEIAELKNYIPTQLLTSGILAGTTSTTNSKAETQTLSQVALRVLQSTEVDGVTLQKFEISIQLQNG
jgi:Tfp pilus assembly protein PilN